MPKKGFESNLEYKRRVIDPISNSFCAAKWLNATIWLNHGSTVSCHHPNAHPIIDKQRGETLDDLKKNPSLIHNTIIKKETRKQMLNGEKPEECDYCWKTENIDSEVISDRVYKTEIYSDEDIKKCVSEYKDEKDVNPRSLEIAFDSNCNFACAYCGPAFSTTWERELEQNGGYKGLETDRTQDYIPLHSWANLFRGKDSNPYVDAFWDWWPELSKDIEELRVTGGEATISPEFWKLVEWWKKNPDSDIRFAVNTNLGVREEKLDKLVEATKHINNFIIYTSCESFGNQAEYVRDGLVWKDWTCAVERLLTEGQVKELHIMMTVSSLCLFSITDFMDYCNLLKTKYGMFFGAFSVNILRYPSLMSISTLPLNIRLERANHIKKWMYASLEKGIFMHEFEIDSIKRLISLLRAENKINTRRMESDFKKFFTQYDVRRKNKDFRHTFPELIEWYDSIIEIEAHTETELNNFEVKNLQAILIERGNYIDPSWDKSSLIEKILGQ